MGSVILVGFFQLRIFYDNILVYLPVLYSAPQGTATISTERKGRGTIKMRVKHYLRELKMSYKLCFFTNFYVHDTNNASKAHI